MAVYRDEKTGRWFIDYYFRGKRIRECAGTNKRMAEQALSIRKAEILQGKFKIEKLKPSPRFEQFAETFLDWSKANKRSFVRDQSLVKNLRGAFSGKLLSEITPWLIEKYKKDRQAATVHGRAIRPATINREVACLKRMFSKAIEWGQTAENPGAKVKLLREDNRMERILDARGAAASSGGLYRSLATVCRDGPAHRHAFGRNPKPQVGARRFEQRVSRGRVHEEREKPQGPDKRDLDSYAQSCYKGRAVRLRG